MTPELLTLISEIHDCDRCPRLAEYLAGSRTFFSVAVDLSGIPPLAANLLQGMGVLGSASANCSVAWSAYPAVREIFIELPSRLRS